MKTLLILLIAINVYAFDCHTFSVKVKEESKTLNDNTSVFRFSDTLSDYIIDVYSRNLSTKAIENKCKREIKLPNGLYVYTNMFQELK